MRPEAGYLEHEHTADWELEVWAPDFPGLLEQAARGMYAISGTCLEAAPRVRRDLELTALDRESLLVKFLSELLILGEQERLGFDRFELKLGDHCLSAFLEGAPIRSQDKEIKAVTYHNLSVDENKNGLQVRIVFDV